MANLPVPKWLGKAVTHYSELLGIEGMSVVVYVTTSPADDGDVRAVCAQEPDMNECRLEFRPDIEDTPAWRVTIIHELLHVAHARVDHFIDEAVISLLEPQARKLAANGFRQHYESFIQRLATALYEADQGKHRK